MDIVAISYKFILQNCIVSRILLCIHVFYTHYNSVSYILFFVVLFIKNFLHFDFSDLVVLSLFDQAPQDLID